jgi:hypothetical protein
MCGHGNEEGERMNEAKGETKRPTEYDPKVAAIHMAAIREHVHRYLLQSDDIDPEDMDTAMADVERAMDLESDGFRIAENLESRGWTASAKLVETMHWLVAKRSDAHRQVVREWVRAEGIRQGFAVGDRVVFESRKNRPAEVDGEIIKVEEEEGYYLVFIASEGHVRKGIGTHGTYVPFEDVRPYGTAPAAASVGAPA